MIKKIMMVLLTFSFVLVINGCKKGEVDIRFNHNLHVVENGIDCDTCHKMNDNGVMSNPDMDVCSDCHDIDTDHPSKDCLTCHTIKSAKNDYEVEETGVKIPDSYKDIQFTHDPHTDYKCTKCHKGIDKDKSLSKIKFPKMDLCMQCHNDDIAPKECSTCHKKIRKNIPPESHATDWEMRHGFESKVDNSCKYCHGKSGKFCQDCHHTQKPRDHIFGWKTSQHGIEATHDRKLCAVCHTASFCSDCHNSQEPISHKRADWVRFMPKPGHAEAAERNIRSCNVCHTVSDCIKCHNGTSVLNYIHQK